MDLVLQDSLGHSTPCHCIRVPPLGKHSKPRTNRFGSPVLRTPCQYTSDGRNVQFSVRGGNRNVIIRLCDWKCHCSLSTSNWRWFNKTRRD
ncbi:hypothetical protein LMH87_003109 [Akanthomyces muscarius]|uniref:Uncharacterized protein n=1 Tax=Akanthomyces muscarius TaxID=2231603 RepID=A0A9W8Q2P3_AKAMU|nr:hypothetical protein LMH87_003109 [Akanthomyces muscarius]KAJ4144219.1 hypothetical protein LMH87_003109 [Akanthomyces muscarius]